MCRASVQRPQSHQADRHEALWDSASQISGELLIQYVFPSSGFSEDLLAYRQEEQFLTQILNDVASITNMNTFKKRNPTFGVATKDKRPGYKIN